MCFSQSDIVVMLADSRAPLLHFSEALFKHIAEEHGKPAVLLLNKADLVPTSVIAMWEGYFRDKVGMLSRFSCSFHHITD